MRNNPENMLFLIQFSVFITFAMPIRQAESIRSRRQAESIRPSRRAE